MSRLTMIGSHMDTCPNWKSQGAKARADAHTEAIQNWRLSCETPKPHDPIDAKTVVLFDVPEKHATPIALKLTLRVLASRCPHSALQEDSRQRYSVKAVLVTPAIYNRIHDHLHGFALSVFSDMTERKPVTVAGYGTEFGVEILHICNLADLCRCAHLQNIKHCRRELRFPTETLMKFQYTIEQLEVCKKDLERDIQWYKRKNKPGVNLSAEYRKEMIAEHTAQLTEIVHAIKLLSDDRFNAIEANLIQFDSNIARKYD